MVSSLARGSRNISRLYAGVNCRCRFVSPTVCPLLLSSFAILVSPMVFYRSIANATLLLFCRAQPSCAQFYFLELQNKNFARAVSYAQFTAGFATLNQRGFLRALALKPYLLYNPHLKAQHCQRDDYE